MPDPRLNNDFDDLDGEKYILKNFMKDMPTVVCIQPPTSMNKLRVFWSDPTTVSPFSIGIGGTDNLITHTPISSSTTNQGIITEKIKSALVGFDNIWCMDGVLIQFWIPMRRETGCLQLVTSDQPFALTCLDHRLLKYRKHCLEYKFNLHGEEEEVQQLGIPARVFRQKWHESIPDVRYYTSKEYPQRNFALTCAIGASLAFPVFHTSTSFHDCVGVLEFVTTTDTHFRVSCGFCDIFWYSLKGVDLKSCGDCSIILTVQQYYPDAVNAIHQGLKVVCTTHNLPLALMWVPCNQHVLHAIISHSYVTDDNIEFLDYCSGNGLRNGQGLSGGHIYYSIYSLKNDFVLEFFLNPKNTYEEHPTTFLCSLLETMKQQFPVFKLVSGQQLGKELSIEFIKPHMNQKLTSSPCHSPRSPSEETMQPPSSNQQQIAEAEVDINNERNVVNAGQNNTPVSCSDEARMTRELASFQCQNTIGTGALNNGQETMQPHSSNQQKIAEVVDINNQRNVVNAKQNNQRNNTPVFCSDEAITYEELKIHFGKKLEDVAQIFGVSRSTFKRICRKKGIHHWKWGNRSKVYNSPSRPPCSDLPAENLVPTLPHMTPLVTPPSEARTITIKATCGDDMLKFQLPFSSRMVDLEEEVYKRWKLDVGTYKIKYTDGDGDQILIACEKDLQDCMSDSNSLGMNTIKMLIDPITKISPTT